MRQPQPPRQGSRALLPGEPLNKAARLHARNMARLHFFDHTDPQGRNVDDRVAIFDQAHRFTFIGENIAGGFATGGPYGRYYVQVFAATSSANSNHLK